MEMDVEGHVAGEDGRAGMRGIVVDKAGLAMRNAMVGGFLSSVGNFLGQNRNPLIFSPNTGLAQTNPATGGELLKQSMSNGMGGALEKYADFYIKRAEQMQPVILVESGRKVDIVFRKGFDSNDSAMRQAISRVNDTERFQQIQEVKHNIQDWVKQ